jgi:rod shape-determining protein MreD
VKYAAHVGIAYLTLLLAGPLWPVLPFEVAAPNLVAIFAAYLGITARGGVAGPTAAALAIGWLADLLGGSPRGLMALVAGVICVVARFATARLLVRGAPFVAGFCAGLALVGAVVVQLVRAAYGASRGPFASELVVAIGSAVLTGLVAPPLFRLCRLVDSRFARTEREREAVREGYLN